MNVYLSGLERKVGCELSYMGGSNRIYVKEPKTKIVGRSNKQNNKYKVK